MGEYDIKGNVSIALCTHNGEKYLQEQLNSLLNQTFPPFELIVSDDNSVDGTLKILEKFSSSCPFPIKIYHHKESLGTAQNFAFALEKTCGEYIAFCDQDDVWMPQKMELTLGKMKQIESLWGKDISLLVHTDLCVVDKNMATVFPSFMDALHLSKEASLARLLVQNSVTGCAMMINRHLKELSLPFPPKIIMHDWWLALLAAAAGAIGYIDEPTIYYRQHGDNSVGANAYFSLASIKNFLSAKRNLLSIEAMFHQGNELANRLKERGIFCPQAEIFLCAVKSGNIKSMCELGMGKSGVIKNLLFYGYLLWYVYGMGGELRVNSK